MTRYNRYKHKTKYTVDGRLPKRLNADEQVTSRKLITKFKLERADESISRTNTK